MLLNSNHRTGDVNRNNSSKTRLGKHIKDKRTGITKGSKKRAHISTQRPLVDIPSEENSVFEDISDENGGLSQISPPSERIDSRSESREQIRKLFEDYTRDDVNEMKRKNQKNNDRLYSPGDNEGSRPSTNHSTHSNISDLDWLMDHPNDLTDIDNFDIDMSMDDLLLIPLGDEGMYLQQSVSLILDTDGLGNGHSHGHGISASASMDRSALSPLQTQTQTSQIISFPHTVSSPYHITAKPIGRGGGNKSFDPERLRQLRLLSAPSSHTHPHFTSNPSPPGSLEDLASDLFLFKPSSKALPLPSQSSSNTNRKSSNYNYGNGNGNGPTRNASEKSLHTNTLPADKIPLLQKTWAAGHKASTGGAIGPVSAGHAITLADIHEIRAFTNLSPQLWVLTRALYVLLFMYLDVMGDSAMTDRGGERMVTCQVIDMSNLWLTLRKQRDSLRLTVATVLDQYSWPLLRSLMTMSRLLVIAMNKQIPMDSLFRQYFPDKSLPWVQKAVEGNLFKPEVIGVGGCRSGGVGRVGKWVRAVTALLWVEKKKQGGGVMFAEDEDQNETAAGRRKKSTQDPSTVPQPLDTDDWVSLSLLHTYDQDESPLPIDTFPVISWHKVPYSVKRHAKPKVYSCSVDGLPPSYAAYKTTCRLCRDDVDRLELLHVYNNDLMARVTGGGLGLGGGGGGGGGTGGMSATSRRSVTKEQLMEAALAPTTLDNSPTLITPTTMITSTGGNNNNNNHHLATSSGTCEGVEGVGGVGMTFSADATPGVVKAMYESELQRDGASLSLRRVICVAREPGRTVPEEIARRVNETACDVLVIAMDRLGVSPAIASATAGLTNSPNGRAVTASGSDAAGGYARSRSLPGHGGHKDHRVISSSSSSVTSSIVGDVVVRGGGDKVRLNYTDFRRLRCAVVISSPVVPITINVNVNEVDLSDSQAAVELALSLGRRGDSIILLHVPPPPSIDGGGRRPVRERALRMSQSYNAAYGISVQIESLHGADTVAERILSFVTAMKPDFLVLGAGASPSLSSYPSPPIGLLNASTTSISSLLPELGVTETVLGLVQARGLGGTSVVVARSASIRSVTLTAP
eukprot:gene9571-19885_t